MFRDPSISDYYRNLQQEVRGKILRESDEQIVGSDIDELIRYFYEQYAFSPIEEDSVRDASYDLQDYLENIPAHRREDFYGQLGDYKDFQSQRAIVEVSILPNPNISEIARLQGATISMSYNDQDFNWGSDRITATVRTKGYGFEYDENKIAQEVEQALQRIRESIRFRNQSINSENILFLQFIRQTVEERRKKITADSEKLSSLTKKISIPIKKKEPVGAQPIRVVHTPLVQRIKPKATVPVEYVLDEERANDIIALLDNQARSFENTPKVFKALGEENLRDVLLSNLNSVFEGGATGETFSKRGKTDIYLKISKGNILIAECKVWGGKALYSETIDQLRGYLTWRHNYGIMITFVQIKDFTKILRESEATIQMHPSYMNGFKKLNGTHFVSNHHVDDEEKEVKIHHLFYHLY
jgi:hypothetical protein